MPLAGGLASVACVSSEDLRFQALPARLRHLIVQVGEPSPSEWAAKPLPALQGRSVLDLAEEDGVAAAEAFVVKVIGKFS